MTTDNSVMTHQMFVTAYVTQLTWDVNEGESVIYAEILRFKTNFQQNIRKKEQLILHRICIYLCPFPSLFLSST